MNLIVIVASIILVLLFTGMVTSALIYNGMNRDQEAEDDEQMKYIESLKKKRKE